MGSAVLLTEDQYRVLLAKGEEQAQKYRDKLMRLKANVPPPVPPLLDA